MLIFDKIKITILDNFFDILLELFKILTYPPPLSILDKNRPIGIGLSEMDGKNRNFPNCPLFLVKLKCYCCIGASVHIP